MKDKQLASAAFLFGWIVITGGYPFAEEPACQFHEDVCAWEQYYNAKLEGLEGCELEQKWMREHMDTLYELAKRAMIGREFREEDSEALKAFNRKVMGMALALDKIRKGKHESFPRALRPR